MANVIFNSFLRDVGNGSIDWDTDTIKLMLCTAAFTPDRDLHTKRSDITNEVSGTGYTAGGVTLSGRTVTQDNTNNRGVYRANNVVIPNSTITARWAVIYKSRGGAATADELVVAVDFLADITSTNGDFTINWHADGIFYNVQN